MGKIVCCCFTLIFVVLLIGLEVSKICMGAKYFHSCSIDENIPIWLIVSGGAPIFFAMLFFVFGGQNNDNKDDSNIFGSICGAIGFIFILAWLICGSVRIYPKFDKVTSDDFNPCTGNVTTGCTQGDCNETLIKFAFAMVTADWVCMGLWIFTIAGLICTVCCRT